MFPRNTIPFPIPQPPFLILTSIAVFIFPLPHSHFHFHFQIPLPMQDTQNGILTTVHLTVAPTLLYWSCIMQTHATATAAAAFPTGVPRRTAERASGFGWVLPVPLCVRQRVRRHSPALAQDPIGLVRSITWNLLQMIGSLLRKLRKST